MEGFDEVGPSHGLLEDFAVRGIDLDFESGFEREFGETLAGSDVDSFHLVPGLDFEIGVLLESLEHLLGADSQFLDRRFLLGGLDPSELLFELEQDPAGDHDKEREGDACSQPVVDFTR